MASRKMMVWLCDAAYDLVEGRLTGYYFNSPRDVDGEITRLHHLIVRGRDGATDQEILRLALGVDTSEGDE